MMVAKTCTGTHRHRAAGFTLLELLVAMAIFAVIGALALGGLNAVLTQHEQARRQLDRLNQVQRAVRLLTDDFSQFTQRPVRDALGTFEYPLLAPCGVEFVVCVSRGGWRTPFFQFARGELQRVHYKLDDGRLIRSYWAVMDRTLVNEPREEVLLDEVEEFRVEFLDQAGTEWVDIWDPGSQVAGSSGRPAAARVTFTLRGWGEIVRIVEMLG